MEKNKNTTTTTNIDIKNIKGDNFEFLEMVQAPPSRELTLPLTDMECGLIENVFLYQRLIGTTTFEAEGKQYRVTDQARQRYKEIFDILVGILAHDIQAVEKMDEYRRLRSVSMEASQPQTRKEGKSRVNNFGTVN